MAKFQDRLERTSHAKLCAELAETAAMEPTAKNIEAAEDATVWFEKLHHDTWSKYLPKQVRPSIR